MSDKSADSGAEELPGSVSNQNGEEAEPGHGGGPEKRRPSSGDKSGKGGGDSEGESSEGSQSTGDPNSAG
ncbi:MAG: hypothetical protein ACR2GZ_10590 [Solirubrobacteraceae bacterium]